MSEQQPDDYEIGFLVYSEKRREIFRCIFGIEEPENRIIPAPGDLLTTCWFGGGVYQFPPSDKLPHWHYVTEAISQPDNPITAPTRSELAYAFELVISTQERAAWPVNALMWLARHYFRHGRPFYHDEVIPCGAPLVAGSKLTHLIAVAAREYEPEFQLPGLACSFVHMVGVAEDELAPALSIPDLPKGIHALYRVLCHRGLGSCTMADRPSLASLPGFMDEWWTELAKLD